MNETNINKVKAVVFDMAGTTIDEGKTVYRCVQEAIAQFGFDYTLDEVMNRIGGMNKKEGIRLLMNTGAVNTPEEKIEQAFGLFRENVEAAYKADKAVVEKEGASDLFMFLQEQDIKVVLDTGYFRSTADILINKMGWANEGLIDYSVTSDEVEMGRPEPLMIRKMMAHFELTDASQIVKVGDTRSDIEEGHNAGCTTVVGISSDMYRKEDLLEMGATHAIDQLEELKTIISA